MCLINHSLEEVDVVLYLFRYCHGPNEYFLSASEYPLDSLPVDVIFDTRDGFVRVGPFPFTESYVSLSCKSLPVPDCSFGGHVSCVSIKYIMIDTV